MRSSSLGLLTLWSMETLLAICLSVQIIALVSPKLPMQQILRLSLFLNITRQQVEPVSEALISLTYLSTLLQILSKRFFGLLLSLSYYY